uniref:Uncharacterized protein n=1 Tax=Peronospora matthiolae TaxID=2874970 RepID=A0AAV1UTZ1_9STRA
MSKVPTTASFTKAARHEEKRKHFAATCASLSKQHHEMVARRENIERKTEELEKLQHEKLQSLKKSERVCETTHEAREGATESGCLSSRG